MRIILILLLVSLAGCESIDPYRRTDVWYPTGSNAGNIAAQAVRPHDLIVGRGAHGADGQLAADAVDRVWTGKTGSLAAVSSAPAVAAPAPVSAAPPGTSQ
jgi:type IV pilus biogenesis protein CpaD/CtpE